MASTGGETGEVPNEGGRRVARWGAGESTPELPLFTVVTAVFNSARGLRDTIASVQQQTFPLVEHIVVDGASTDGTVAILRECDGTLEYWHSEPDTGIYDAWNKGVKFARGEWIAFLGAGDCYYPDALEHYAEAARAHVEDEVQYISSRVELVRGGRVVRTIGDRWAWPPFSHHMTVGHVGSVHHRSLFRQFGLFNPEYRVVGDYEFLLRPREGLRAVFVDRVTATMELGGSSNANFALAVREAAEPKQSAADVRDGAAPSRDGKRMPGQRCAPGSSEVETLHASSGSFASLRMTGAWLRMTGAWLRMTGAWLRMTGAWRRMTNLVRRYGLYGSLRLLCDVLVSRLMFPQARLVRRPFYIRADGQVRLGRRFTSGPGLRIDAFGKDALVHIGVDVQVNDYVHIAATQRVVIGDRVLIASGVFISDHDHGAYTDTYASSPLVPPAQRPLRSAPVEIGDDCWLGEHVCVLPGVRLGRGVVVGAGSVVTRDVAEFSLVVGVPARVIKRFDLERGCWVASE